VEAAKYVAGLDIYDTVMFGYFVAFFTYALHAFILRRPGFGRFAWLILACAFVLHTAFLIQRAVFYYQQYQGFVLPATNMFEALGYFAWLVVLVYFVCEALLLKTRFLGVFALLVPVAAMAYTATGMSGDPRELMPSLKSYWLVFHITAMFLSYAALALAFSFALMYLICASGWRNLERIDPRLNLRFLDHASYQLILFAFPALTLGIFLGAVWADEAWGRPWGWDPKETWALITWLIYLAYLHLRIQRGWVGYRSALLNIVGFAAMLITFIGVNLLDSLFGLGSIHAYAKGGGVFVLLVLGLAVLIPVTMQFLPMPDHALVNEQDQLTQQAPVDSVNSAVASTSSKDTTAIHERSR